MPHCIVPEAEAILDKEFRVLDKGFVRLVDYLGSDERIASAARVSYGDGTKTVSQDRNLIHYLLRNEHTSPFEQVVYTFHAKMPIFVARQWIRHRMARVNEISGRYSILKDEFYVPDVSDIALQSTNNKQGRSDEVPSQDVQNRVRSWLIDHQRDSYAGYNRLIDSGIARELARINLPLSVYTEWYWQIDLHNLLHFLKLRLDHHAQKEIRDYAEVIRDLARRVCPYAFESFENEVMNSVRLSGREVDAIKRLMNGDSVDLDDRSVHILKGKLGIL